MQWIKPRHVIVVFAVLTVMLNGGCAVNPVTGEQELRLISQSSEIKMGEENYVPMQQSQGGQYTVDPGVTAYVQEVGRKLAAVSDRKLPYEFTVINDGVPNAWALPGGKIGINRGLLVELHNEAELAAVLGHEIVHAAAGHSANQIERSMGLNLGLVVLGAAVSDKNNSGLIMGAGAVGAALLTQKFSRGAELEADKYGIKYMAKAGYDPQAAVELQKTFVRLSKGNNPGWLDGLFASHPPSQERVEANRKTAAKYERPGLILGKERYQQHIAILKKTEPAYDKYQQGRKAFNDGKLDQALTDANQAIQIEPREGLFHALKGDVYLKRNQTGPAIKAYDAAIKDNPQFFYYYLQRGLSYKAQGEKTAARTDLQRSNQLLPTEAAQQALKAL
jgi:predicted Zn-dependent protease